MARVSLLGCVLLIACSPAAEAPDREAGALEVERLMEVARIPGLVVARLEGGEISSVDRHGVADASSSTAVEEDTMFEAASLSKPVFSTVVLRLAERGELDLDRPLYELLVSERLTHDSRSRELTARLVLSHRTGLPNWGGEKLQFQRAPGEAFGYSGEGYVYLQQALERLTGSSLDELAEREVFEPLGMEHSRFSWAEGEQLALARPHDEVGKPVDKRPAHQANAAASLHTTAEDYARFVGAWLDGSLLGTEMASEALEAQSFPQPDDDATREQIEASPRIAWSLGWGIQLDGPASGEAAVSSSDDGPDIGVVTAGATYWHWGDNGPFKAFVAFRPDSGSGVVYFANSANGLAIGRTMVEGAVGSMDATFDWLAYDRVDAPGFGERLDGLAAENEGRFDEAIVHYQAVLETIGEDAVLERRIDWLSQSIEVREEPVTVAAETLKRYAGSYGPRSLTFEDGTLHYQREGASKYRLIPLAEDLFALHGLTFFRIEIGVDGEGTPTKIVGHYVTGSTDESPRDRG